VEYPSATGPIDVLALDQDGGAVVFEPKRAAGRRGWRRCACAWRSGANSMSAASPTLPQSARR
jgi:hypothetical protein